MFVQSHFFPAYKVTLGTLTKEVWDWIKINLGGFCCNHLLSGLGSAGFFSSSQLLVYIINLKHVNKYSKLPLCSLMSAAQESVQLFNSISWRWSLTQGEGRKHPPLTRQNDGLALQRKAPIFLVFILNSIYIAFGSRQYISDHSIPAMQLQIIWGKAKKIKSSQELFFTLLSPHPS